MVSVLDPGIAFVVLVLAATEALSRVIPLVGGSLVRGRVQARGKHLDVLTFRDFLFVLINRFATVPFAYHLRQTLSVSPDVRWGRPTLAGSVLALPALFLVYDLLYSLFHRTLHHRRCVAALPRSTRAAHARGVQRVPFGA